MKNEQIQLGIIQSQLNQAITLLQKAANRYAALKGYGDIYEVAEADRDDEVAKGIISAIGGADCAFENI